MIMDIESLLLVYIEDLHLTQRVIHFCAAQCCSDETTVDGHSKVKGFVRRMQCVSNGSVAFPNGWLHVSYVLRNLSIGKCTGTGP